MVLEDESSHRRELTPTNQAANHVSDTILDVSVTAEDTAESSLQKSPQPTPHRAEELPSRTQTIHKILRNNESLLV